MTLEPTVFIVDDDPAYLDSISVLIQSLGMQTKTFPSAEAFLREFNPQQPGCLILDVRMPVMGGLVLQESLSKLPICPPIIIMTGHAEVPTALRAIRQGAVDFLQKTFSEAELYEALQRALAKDATNRKQFLRATDLTERFGKLSPAEHAVLQLVLRGDTNKKIATTLDVSQRAVEDRRSRLMEKLSVSTVPDLIRLAIEAGLWKGE
ncbi:MAG: histidine kinase [Planctomycetaceae bacterium]|nr:histidine kinase [Planctomycetaceae bacterium]